ncbi:MAG: asparaginase [Clostridia bacterium]|nr:asparaginase [Clostridia bacterium]
MKILFVFTGGTIGSENVDGIADVSLNVSKNIPTIINMDCEWEFAFPFNILSENATCDTLSELVTYMLSIDYDKYDGIVLTHGSDTLAYTSALLCNALSWVKVPIVITAANYVMSDPRSNARENLNSAMAFIKQSKHSGVYVVWKNEGEPAYVHFGERLIEADECDRFRSYGGAPFGIVENGEYRDIAPCEIRFGDKNKHLKNKKIKLNNKILLLHSYVGLDFSAVDTTGISAVLLKMYHSATACTQGDATSINALIENCRKTGTDLYLIPKRDSGYIYSSETSFDHTFVKYLPDMSEYAAYTMLLLLYRA